MPYFIYKLTLGSSGDLKNPEFQGEHETYREAKSVVRGMRIDLEEQGSDALVRMIFADEQDQALDMLMKHREAPILREWEK